MVHKREKVSKWDLIKIQNIYTSTDTVKKWKVKLTWRKYLQNISNKRLVSRIYLKNSSNLTYKVENNPIKKMSKRYGNRYFTQEDIQMTNKYMKGLSATLVIRKVQTETTMIHHFTLTRIAIVRQTTTNVSEYLEKWESSYIVGGIVKWYNHLGNCLPFLQKINIKLWYDATTLL